MRTIDMTPTWSEVLGLCLEAYENGNAKGRAAAMGELQRMAHLADCASIIMGAHRRPDAPAIPEAQAIRDRLDAAAKRGGQWVFLFSDGDDCDIFEQPVAGSNTSIGCSIALRHARHWHSAALIHAEYQPA